MHALFYASVVGACAAAATPVILRVFAPRLARRP